VAEAVIPGICHARSTPQQAERVRQTQPLLKVSRSRLVNTNHGGEPSRTLRGDFMLVPGCGVAVTSSEGFRDGARECLVPLQPGP
jgi:two-component system LytT family response regulator